MGIKKRRVPELALEPDRLQKVLAAANERAELIKKVRLEMQHTATTSVLVALRSEKLKHK
jgi:hypothetical protein